MGFQYCVLGHRKAQGEGEKQGNGHLVVWSEYSEYLSVKFTIFFVFLMGLGFELRGLCKHDSNTLK
jgi:hypothetical protein